MPPATAPVYHGRLSDEGGGYAGDGLHLLQRKGHHLLGRLFPTGGVLLDELGVDEVLLDQHPQQAVEEGNVSAGAELKVQVCLVDEGDMARVDDDEPLWCWSQRPLSLRYAPDRPAT